MKSVALLVAAVLAGTQVFAQCPRPDLYEVGGVPYAITSGVGGFQAVSRGRFVQMMSGSGAVGSVVATLGLNSRVRHMHTEIAGRIWAVDTDTVYGIDCAVATNPQVIGSLKLPILPADYLVRVRVHGSFVYAIGHLGKMYIVDVTNPAAPVLRSTFQAAANAKLTDIEVVGSYAYGTIHAEFPNSQTLVTIDIASPINPVEVSRVGAGVGVRISAPATSNGYIYTLVSDFLFGGHILKWSLANPGNPVVAATSALVPASEEQEELRVTPGCVVYLDGMSDSTTGAVLLLNSNTLATVGQAIALPRQATAMGTDSIYLYVGHMTGQVDRVNILDQVSPTVTQTYLASFPGESIGVANINNGYSVVTHYNATCFFRTQVNGPPVLISRITPPANCSVGETIAMYSDMVYTSEYDSTADVTYLRAYRVTIAPVPSVSLVGSFAQQGHVRGFDLGSSGANSYLFYTSDGPLLHTLNINNPGAMTHIGAVSLTADVGWAVKFLGASPLFGQPARIVVGGGLKVQILLATNAAAPSSLSLIPDGSPYGLLPGPGPTLWLIDYNARLHVYDIANPVTPALLSTTQLPVTGPTDFRFIDPFGNQAACTMFDGTFVRLSTFSPGAPAIVQIAKLAERLYGMAFDGTQLHMAAGVDGYKILPAAFDAPPAEDSNAALSGLGRKSIIPICPGLPLTITSHFVGIPAVTGWQWQKFDGPSNSYVPIVNGPTGTGSTVSGATTATLTITNPGAADSATYSCRASNTCGFGPTGSGVSARIGGYANCDGSTAAPAVNVNDFQCFLNRFAAGDSYANCDGSTAIPSLNVNDFQCFINEFASTCHN